MTTATPISAQRGLLLGFFGGVAASIVMAIYAMITGLYQPTGFFTPLYHIASVFIPPKAMMTSMSEALQGKLGFFSFTPALVGAAVHMMTGGIAGAIFGFSATRKRLAHSAIILSGTVFGLFVMVFNSFIVLPIAAKLFGGGKPISQMGKIVGWERFTIEHLIFGLGLGLILVGFLAGSNKKAYEIAE